MKKVKNLTMRSLAVLVALMLCVGLLGTVAFAAEDEKCDHPDSVEFPKVWVWDNEGHYLECTKCKQPVDDKNGAMKGPHDFYYQKNETGHTKMCYCGYSEGGAAHTWDGGKVILEPTCETEGKTIYTCTFCGWTETRKDIPAIGHAYGDWKAIDGEMHEHVCANDDSHIETGAHNFERINPIQEKCTDCGYVRAAGVIQRPEESVMPTVCTHDNAVILEEVAATCTETGLTEGLYCPDCDTVLVEQEETQIDPDNHTDVVTDDAVAPTCTLTGLTEGSHCEACDVILVAQDPIPATGHTFGAWVVVRAATTEQTGLRVSTCIHGDAQVEEEIPMLDDETEDPEIEIPEEDVPLTPNPEDEEIDIPEEDVPLAPGPEDEEIEIPEDDVPLAAVPQTGDYSYIWGFFALISGAALAMLVITNKKREENV